MAAPQVLVPNGTGSTTPRAPVTGFGVEFRPFLHTQLWEEQNGMRLSILSALARLDLDPWEEAATLAQLPSDAAARRFSDLLRNLPGAPAGAIGYEPLYKRALALLPVSKPLPSTDTTAAIANPKTRARWRLMVDLAFFASMLASFALMAAQVSHGRADDAHPNPPAAASPPSPAAR